MLNILNKVDISALANVVLPHRSLNFRVALVADQYTFAPGVAVVDHFHMNLGHQRARRIKYLQAPARRLVPNRFGDTMSAENHDFVVGHFIELIDKYGTSLPKVLNNKLVVNNFVAHVDW